MKSIIKLFINIIFALASCNIVSAEDVEVDMEAPQEEATIIMEEQLQPAVLDDELGSGPNSPSNASDFEADPEADNFDF
jgi:hypothetical protein